MGVLAARPASTRSPSCAGSPSRPRRGTTRSELLRRVPSRDQHRGRTVQVRQDALEILDLRYVVDRDIGVGWVARQKILMIGLGRIERAVRFNSRDDGFLERMGLIELRDVGLRNLRLLGAGREDRRAILRPAIRTL